MKNKINEIQAYRDAQEKQMEKDTEGWTAIQRVQNALQITHIDGILKGLDVALEILNKK